MAFFKTLDPSDIKTTTSYLNQLIDVLQESISGSDTRRPYQVFVTSSQNPVVTSITYSVTGGLFQTIYDQDFTLATANPVFDMTIGLYASCSTTTGSTGYDVDSSGKLLFSSNTMMMREKVALYKEFAQTLLGDADLRFSSPFTNPGPTDYIDEALFLTFKRLFARDKIKPETYAMKFYTTGVTDSTTAGFPVFTNVDRTSTSGSTIFSDVGAASSIEISYGGQVGNIINTSITSQKVGLIFYDAGVVVLDAKKIISGSQHVSGVISAVTGTGSTAVPPSLMNQTVIGSSLEGCNSNAAFIPDFFVSGSIDDVVKHFATCRFSSGSDTGITFQNVTNINSTLAFCRATADEFNFSTNPTFVDDAGRIRVIDLGEETTQRSFAFVTSIGLYNAAGDLLAVAKLSRPIEKNDERDLTFRVRLDF
jgi:hypothetical protein